MGSIMISVPAALVCSECSLAQTACSRCVHTTLQHVAVHLAFGIADDEFHILAQLARHLPHDALKARQHAFEGHHARAHQAFLQLGVDTRLLLQKVVGVLVATLGANKPRAVKA